MRLKSLNENFDKMFSSYEDNTLEKEEKSIVESLEECLSKLQESEMSDEDRADSDLIRSMILKMQNRSNAKFTPEENAVLDKYGIKRDNWGRQLTVDGVSINPGIDTKTNSIYDWKTNKRTTSRNADVDKINYADRARKVSQRKANRVGDYNTNAEINAHTRSRYSDSTLQSIERGNREYKDRKPVLDMQYALDIRKTNQKALDDADRVYRNKVDKARADFDKAMNKAKDDYGFTQEYSTKRVDDAQKTINKLLKKEENLNESPSYDLRPQYDARQSFYNKARVEDNGSELVLYSYNTPVAKIVDDSVELLPKWDYSQTTLRHVKEFLKQNGFETGSVSELRKMYC
jgi:hypothetical protein